MSGVGAGSASAEASVREAGLAFGLLDLALDDLALVVGHLQRRRGGYESVSASRVYPAREEAHLADSDVDLA